MALPKPQPKTAPILNIAPRSGLDLADESAEQAVLGALIVSGHLFKVVSRDLKANDFFFLSHRYIWEAMEAVSKDEQPIDYLTVIAALRSAGKLDEIGGAVFLTKICGVAVSSMHAQAYASIVSDLATRRRMVVAADDIKALAHRTDMKLADVSISSANALQVASGQLHLARIGTVAERIEEYINQAEKRYKNPKKDTAYGIPTGIKPLDAIIRGLPKRQLVLIGGVNGMGKTVAAMNIMLNTARLNLRTAFYGREMDEDRLNHLLISIESGIPQGRIAAGDFASEDEWKKFLQACANVYEIGKRMHIWKAPTDPDFIFSPDYIARNSEALLYESGLDLIIVDHLHIMETEKPMDDPSKYKYIAKSMEAMSKRLGIPVVMLAQISMNKIKNTAEKRPEKGALDYNVEPHADIVFYVHHPHTLDPTQRADKGEIIVVKNRDHSTTSIIPVAYRRNRFTEYGYDMERTYPDRTEAKNADAKSLVF